MATLPKSKTPQTSFICDKCKQPQSLESLFSHSQISLVRKGVPLPLFDLCEDCSMEIIDWIGRKEARFEQAGKNDNKPDQEKDSAGGP